MEGFEPGSITDEKLPLEKWFGDSCLPAVCFGGLLLWLESDLQEAAPAIPCALGKTNSAALLSWCTKLTALAGST